MIIKYVLVIAVLSTVLIHQNSSGGNDVPTIAIATLQEIRCMELNLHYEARGEGFQGLLAVANVTKNRVKSKLFPNTYCGVVSQPRQFSWYPFRKDIPVADHIRKLAMQFVLHTKVHGDNTGGALFFHRSDLDPFDRRVVAKIGNHIFYR